MPWHAGPVPDWGREGSMQQLTTIDVEDCNLTGTLPASISAQLPNMEIFQLNNNSLTGTPQAWGVRGL